MEKNQLAEIGESLFQKSEKETADLDKSFIQMAKDLKELYGRPVDDPQVQQMVAAYLQSSFAFIGEDVIEKLAEVDLESINIDELEEMAPSPFTEAEEKWLHEAIIYSMAGGNS